MNYFNEKAYARKDALTVSSSAFREIRSYKLPESLMDQACRIIFILLKPNRLLERRMMPKEKRLWVPALYDMEANITNEIYYKL
jgi:hypothetical protein